MIISPPFLPDQNNDVAVYDARCVNHAMFGGVVGSGAFPVSQSMAWHGGMHLEAASAEDAVRAIADGIVIFRREDQPQVYEGSAYSSGCIVIRHETELGARVNASGAAVGVKFIDYSITLQLSSLDKDLPTVGKPDQAAPSVWWAPSAINLIRDRKPSHCPMINCLVSYQKRSNSQNPTGARPC